MKTIALASFWVLLGNMAMANSSSNFSGNWIGTCSVNGKVSPSEKLIEQVDEMAISINGTKFDLTKPTVTTLDGEDEGKTYREITVYDWQWDAEKQVINTNAQWMGWYTDAPGSWQGSGTGIIKFGNGTLITTRKFGDIEEFCSYPKNAD